MRFEKEPSLSQSAQTQIHFHCLETRMYCQGDTAAAGGRSTGHMCASQHLHIYARIRWTLALHAFLCILIILPISSLWDEMPLRQLVFMTSPSINLRTPHLHQHPHKQLATLCPETNAHLLTSHTPPSPDGFSHYKSQVRFFYN